MTLDSTLLNLGSIVGVAVLSVSVASHRVDQEVCSYNPVKITLDAQRAINDRLVNFHFPIFSYSDSDHTDVSNKQCDWTVLGHVEVVSDGGTRVRLRWGVNLSVKPGDLTSASTVVSSIVF